MQKIAYATDHDLLNVVPEYPLADDNDYGRTLANILAAGRKKRGPERHTAGAINKIDDLFFQGVGPYCGRTHFFNSTKGEARKKVEEEEEH